MMLNDDGLNAYTNANVSLACNVLKLSMIDWAVKAMKKEKKEIVRQFRTSLHRM